MGLFDQHEVKMQDGNSFTGIAEQQFYFHAWFQLADRKRGNRDQQLMRDGNCFTCVAIIFLHWHCRTTIFY